MDNAGYAIDDFVARSAQASVRMACRASGFEVNSPCWISGGVRQLELDRAVLNILPPGLREQWYKYLPAGELDAEVRFSFDGQTWRPEIAARCLNVSFTHHKFPYRLENGKGTLDVKDDRLQMSLTAYAGSRPLRLTADVAHPFGDATGQFEVEGDDLQLDESLVAALTEKPRAGRPLARPARHAEHVYVRIWREKPGEPMHHHLLLASQPMFDPLPEVSLSDFRDSRHAGDVRRQLVVPAI